ncbi:TPA: hypothetical protein DEG21_02870 [Patescibacteria group bacterium]|nr:hypothetical protein [Candidatus Gracilibacteria bacterium]HBY74813.1 hypothetical protein [Candidatus Gracilibacteria bacterium]
MSSIFFINFKPLLSGIVYNVSIKFTHIFIITSLQNTKSVAYNVLVDIVLFSITVGLSLLPIRKT